MPAALSFSLSKFETTIFFVRIVYYYYKIFFTIPSPFCSVNKMSDWYRLKISLLHTGNIN